MTPTRLRRLLVATTIAAAGLALTSPAAATYDDDTERKPSVCHPVEGNGETGTGWNIIAPDKASSHIDEETGAGFHTRKDGRTDVYADDAGRCPDTPPPTTEPPTTTAPPQTTVPETVPPTTGPPTTTPPATTEPPVVTTTTEVVAVDDPPVPPTPPPAAPAAPSATPSAGELPATGAAAWIIGGLAAWFVFVGLALRGIANATRKPTPRP